MDIIFKVLLWWLGIPIIIGYFLKSIGFLGDIGRIIFTIIFCLCFIKGIIVLFKELFNGHMERCPHCGSKSSSKYKVCPTCGRRK